MLTKPSVGDILRSLQTEVIARYIPAVADPNVVVDLQMLSGVLTALAIRADHELAWMREETEDILRVARAVMQSTNDLLLGESIGAYEATPSDSIHSADMQAAYNAASVVLACASDAAYRRGDSPLIEAVHRVFAARLMHERRISGAFEAVGRT